MKAMMLHYLLPLKTTIFLLAFPIISAWSVIPENPNVILIVCDDLNDFEGIFGGHPQAKTPELDAFAAGAVRFSNAHSNAPICGPSRCCFINGNNPHLSNKKYVVKLYIDDSCGERYYEKKIIYVKPSKPSKPSKSKPVTNGSNKKKI